MSKPDATATDGIDETISSDSTAFELVPISLEHSVEEVDLDAEIIIAEPLTYTVKAESDAGESDESDQLNIDDPIETPSTVELRTEYLTSKGNTSKLKRSLGCSVCSKRFYKQVHLDAHVRGVHMGFKKPFQCSKCSRVFTYHHQLYHHTKTSHPEVEIDSNHNETDNAESPSSSRISKSEEKTESLPAKVLKIRYQCSQCTKSYPLYSQLSLHKKRRHTNVGSRGRRSLSTFVEYNIDHICPVCMGKFRTKKYLYRHMRRHVNCETRFQCSICDKSFREKKSVTRHVKVVHEGEKRFACTFCERPFATRQAMIAHERRRHTGERPYVCEICDKAFVVKERLKVHMQTHEATDIDYVKRSSTSKRPAREVQ